MFLKIINLQNFRNYQKKTFQFEGLTTLVVGPNTSGKTNLLEAIYLLATGKSFRAVVEAEMIAGGEEIARVEGQIDITLSRDRKWGNGKREAGLPAQADREARVRGGEEQNLPHSPTLLTSKPTSHLSSSPSHLEILLTTGSVSGKKVAKKKYLVNGVSRRMIDFVGQLKAVYFGPEDLQLVTDSPSLRRKYLDMVLFQVDREYRRASLSYEKGVRQRNRVLEEIQRYRDIEIQREEIKRRLYFWDQLLVKNGNYITEKREEFVEFLNSSTKLLNSNLVREGKDGQEGGKGRFGLEYLKSVISPAALEENFRREVILGQTLVGPHRDDIRFETRNTCLPAGKAKHGTRGRKKVEFLSLSHVPCPVFPRDLSIYGSRGEQRLVILWLKMGELEFVSQKTGERPLLLLDDIFSELDKENIRLIGRIGLIERQQTIITTTDEGTVEKNEREKMQVIHLG